MTISHSCINTRGMMYDSSVLVWWNEWLTGNYGDWVQVPFVKNLAPWPPTNRWTYCCPKMTLFKTTPSYSKTRIYQTRFLRIHGVYRSVKSGPNVTPLTSMLNKLGYIELYISKTRIYRSFEVPLPFKSMLITFHISNSSKSLESSQFRDQHTDRNQLTLLSFLTHIYHSYIEHFSSNTMKAINISQFRSRASAP